MKKLVCVIVVLIIIAAVICGYNYFNNKEAKMVNDGINGVVTLAGMKGEAGYGVEFTAGEKEMEVDLTKGDVVIQLKNGDSVEFEGTYGVGSDNTTFVVPRDGMYILWIKSNKAVGTIKYPVEDSGMSADELIKDLVPDNTIENTIENTIPKSEQEGTAGSNMPLIDNIPEAKKVVEKEVKAYIEKAFEGKVKEVKIKDVKVYTMEEREEMEALKDYTFEDLAFDVHYELLPEKGTNPIELTAATGEVNEKTGWVTEKYNCGVLVKDKSGNWEVKDFGTGF